MVLYDSVHPPTEVNVPESLRRQETRSRSPSPLSLRDPQDDGEYQLDDSSDEEGNHKAASQEQRRPYRPLPLSLVAASLDLPSLTQARNSHLSPQGAGRRMLWTANDFPKAVHGEASSPVVSSPKVVTNLPKTGRAEAPFDEGKSAAAAPAMMTASTVTLGTSEETSPILSSPGIADIISQDDMEEPPACDLQEPPSLRNIRRTSNSEVPGPLSPTTLEFNFPKPSSPLPFEDELDEDPTFLEEVEEKKTNEPSIPMPRQYHVSPTKAGEYHSPRQASPYSRTGVSNNSSPEYPGVKSPTERRFEGSIGDPSQWTSKSPKDELGATHVKNATETGYFSSGIDTGRARTRVPDIRNSTFDSRSRKVDSTTTRKLQSQPLYPISPSSDSLGKRKEKTRAVESKYAPYTPSPDIRTWMEEEVIPHRLEPSPNDIIRNRRRIVSQDDTVSPNLDDEDRTSSVSAPVTLQGSWPRRETQENIFDRMQSSHSSDFPDNSIGGLLDGFRKSSPRKQKTRFQSRRLEMNQEEYTAMRNRETHGRDPPIDRGLAEPGDIPLSPRVASSMQSHLTNQSRSVRKSIDPPTATDPLIEPLSLDVPLRKAMSFEEHRQLAPSQADELVGSPPHPFEKSNSFDSPQFRTPRLEYNAAITSASRTNQSTITADPPSLRRGRVPEAKQDPVPTTPRGPVESTTSLGRSKVQQLTPRRSNAAAPFSEPVAVKQTLSRSSQFDEQEARMTNLNETESLSSVDTVALIASLGDLVRDLQGIVGTKSADEVDDSRGHDFIDFFKPLLVQSINNDLGIPKGDIMLSLLTENSERTWASRVTEAVWRCRTMRQNCDTKWLRQKLERDPRSPSKGRTSVTVDLDENAVLGGIERAEETQKSALEHLKYDDFEDALSLYEDIANSYYRYFEGLIRHSSRFSHAVLLERLAYFKAFVGACTHSIGIIHILRGEYSEAHECFDRSTSVRAECHGIGSLDHLTSFGKKAICQLALDDLVGAAKSYEECLALAQKSAKSISDQRQIAEILNNLACLAFLAGRSEKALGLLKESWNSQNVARDHSLYAGARFSGHSSTVNMSVTRANIGFLAMLGKDPSSARDALEYAVNQQQLLLRDAHRTLIASMDHLVVVQVMLGNKDKAARLLRRMYLMQVDAFGADDKRCLATHEKLAMVQESDESAREEKTDKISPGSNDDKAEAKHKGKRPLKFLKKMSKKK